MIAFIVIFASSVIGIALAFAQEYLKDKKEKDRKKQLQFKISTAVTLIKQQQYDKTKRSILSDYEEASLKHDYYSLNIDYKYEKLEKELCLSYDDRLNRRISNELTEPSEELLLK